MRDSLINTCGMKMRKLLDKKSEVFAQEIRSEKCRTGDSFIFISFTMW